MKVLILDKADKELDKFTDRVKEKFINYFRDLAAGEILSNKEFKKLSGYDLYEFRVKDESGIYRAIASRNGYYLVIVLFIHKKSQKTPRNTIETALKRSKNIII